MRVRLIGLAAAVAALVSSSEPAFATIVTRTFVFEASNFFPAASPPPVPVVTGSFTMTYDDAVDVFEAVGAVTNNLNIPVSSPILFTYETRPFSYIRFGGAETGSAALQTGTSDILFQYSPNFGNVLLYSSPLTPNANFFTTDVRVSVINSASAVPEPASWALMIAGFGLAGFALRRRTSALPPKAVASIS